MPLEGDAADLGDPDVGGDLGGDAGDPGGSAFGGDGDGDEGGGGSPASVQDIAAAVDAHLLKEGFGEGDVAGDGKDEGDTEGDTAGTRRSPANRDAIDEHVRLYYQGDYGKFIKSVSDTRSASAELAAKVKELEAKIDHPTPPPTPVDKVAQLKQALTETPEYQAVHRESLFLDNRLKGISTEQTQRAVEMKALDEKIAKQLGQLGSETDPQKRQDLQFEIVSLRQDRGQKDVEFRNAEATFVDTRLHLNSRQRQKADIEAQVEAGLNHQSSSTKSEAAESARTNKHFDTAFATHVKGYALDPQKNARTIGRLYKAVRYELADHLTAREQAGEAGYDQYELSEATAQIVRDVARDFGLRPRSSPTRPPVIQSRNPSTRRPIVGPRPNTSHDLGDGNGRGGSKRDIQELLTVPVGSSKAERAAAADRVRKRSDILIQTASRRAGGRG